MSYWRPLVQLGLDRPAGAEVLAGGWGWFSQVAVHARGRSVEVVPASELPAAVRDRLVAPRADLAGLSMAAPRVMAILNATPDSFSDGGLYAGRAAALAGARALIAAGADLLDVGGESTRPGAETVPEAEETDRVAPLIREIRAEWGGAISVDTRKAGVAEAALSAGASLVNDVSALGYDGRMGAVVAASGAPVCLMHARGAPETMQRDPRYDDVLLDVYDHLEARIAAAERAGIARARIVVDPGIGFGKTLAHNLALLNNLALFHGLGCPILLGASRKRLIGTLAGVTQARDRMPGSVALALAGVAQGVQILRVHDMAETRQALTLWRAATQGGPP